MGDLVKTQGAQLPTHLKDFLGQATETYEEFSGGVTSGFPIISYRGRTWRVKSGGEEQLYLNDDDEAVQSIEVVLLRSNPLPSKTFYKEKYREGDTSPPLCWSATGIKPDEGVPEPVSAACGPCPNNVWGSRITDQGNKTRACSDVRRMAVVFGHELEQAATGEKEIEDVPVMLLRVPPASLNPLKEYVAGVLKPKGVPPFVLVTRVGFDTSVAYPKLTFKGVRFLDEEQFTIAKALREGNEAKRILNEAFENDGGETTDEPESGSPGEPEAETETTAAASPPSPVEQEELNFDNEEGQEETPRPAQVETDAIQPPKPPVRKKKAAKKKKTKKEKAEAEVASQETTTEAPPDDFDEMLNSILG